MPVITDKYAEDLTCVVIEWEEPLQPNGVIIQYEVSIEYLSIVVIKFFIKTQKNGK